MGRSAKRHFKGNNKSNDKKRRRENEQEWQKTRQDNRDDFVTKPENEKFEAFYQAQLNLDESDWNAFLDALKRPLPACFRINPHYPFANELKAQLQQYAGTSQIVDGVEIAPVKQLAWYPNGDGYKLGTDRRTLRKSEDLESLHKWIVQHTDNGNITRQEAVSMVPPLALNVSPHHKCLDMCAAPGSKTTQLLEVIMTSLGSSDEGIVIANDADTDRAYMLVHQCRRLNSPLLMVTTHKGQEFPTVLADFSPSTPTATPIRSSRASGVFDRVLCDVPCSGDGTLRKTPNIWAKWGISSAASLYPLQLQIAERGLRLVKYGGILVYSTCSLSPYEDEAVVAQLLRANKDSLELIDAREFVPHFNCRAGLSQWLVMDDSKVPRKSRPGNTAKAPAVKVAEEGEQDQVTEGVIEEGAKDGDNAEDADQADGDEEEGKEADGMEVAEEAPSATSDLKGLAKCLALGMTHFKSYAEIPEPLQKKYKEFLFPPTPEEAEWMHLERCLRCLPQDEDTGGFFVCAMRRLAPPQVVEQNTGNAEESVENAEKPSAEETPAAPVPEDSNAPVPPVTAAVAAPRGRGVGRATVDLKQWDNDSFLRIQEYFGLTNVTGQEFYIREDYTDSKQRKEFDAGTKDGSKSIYFLPRVAQSIMNGDVHKRLKIVSAGIKVFERCAKGTFAGGGECGYRLLQEGVDVIAPHLTKRKIAVPIQDMCNFIEGGLVSFSTLSPETVSQLNRISTGSILAYYDYRPEDVLASSSTSLAEVVGTASLDLMKSHRMYAVCWRGANPTLNVMCSKLDSESLRHQLQALNVLRPKISAKKLTAASAETESSAPQDEETAGGEGVEGAVTVEAEAGESEAV